MCGKTIFSTEYRLSNILGKWFKPVGGVTGELIRLVEAGGRPLPLPLAEVGVGVALGVVVGVSLGVAIEVALGITSEVRVSVSAELLSFTATGEFEPRNNYQ